MFKVKATSNVEVKNVGLYLMESWTPLTQQSIFQKWDNLIFGKVSQIGIILNVINA